MHPHPTLLAGLPAVAAGRHAGPDSGGCLMEIVSLLAGEPWSDAPRCTHPALAEVARLVNDGSSAGGRAALLELVTELSGVCGPDPRVTPTLVVLAVRHAGSPAGARRDLAAARRRLRALAAGARWPRLTEPLYRRGPARRALARAVQAMGAGRPYDPDVPDPDPATDARLRALLVDAAVAVRQLLARPDRTPAGENRMPAGANRTPDRPGCPPDRPGRTPDRRDRTVAGLSR